VLSAADIRSGGGLRDAKKQPRLLDEAREVGALQLSEPAVLAASPRVRCNRSTFESPSNPPQLLVDQAPRKTRSVRAPSARYVHVHQASSRLPDELFREVDSRSKRQASDDSFRRESVSKFAQGALLLVSSKSINAGRARSQRRQRAATKEVLTWSSPAA